MESTIAYFGLKDEDDYMYKKGETRGEAKERAKAEQKERFMVIKLLDAKLLTEAQIINNCEVTAEFLQTVKKDLMAAPRRIARLRQTMSALQIAQQLRLPIDWVEKQLKQA